MFKKLKQNKHFNFILKKLCQGFGKGFFIFGIIAGLTVSNLGISSVEAKTSHAGQKIVQTYNEINIAPNKEIIFEVHFKNIGTATWSNSGPNFVALATISPEKRDSSFADSSWEEVYRPARLTESQVKPGEIGRFKFILKIPAKEGRYVEQFQAVAKNLAWIESAVLEIPINVTSDVPRPRPTTTVTQTSSVASGIVQISKDDYPVRDSGYSGQLVVNSNQNFESEKNGVLSFQLGVKNTGTQVWSNSGSRFVSLYTVRPNYHASRLADASWSSSHQIKMITDAVKPGEIGYFNFNLKAPGQAGEYIESLRLAVEDYSWFTDGEFKLTVNVVEEKTPVPPALTAGPAPVVVEATDPNYEDGVPYKDLAYQALKLIQSTKELKLRPGQEVQFMVGFKNTGEKTWVNSGSRFVSLYTSRPNYRFSDFAIASTWNSKYQIKMDTASVKPGELGYFTIHLKAPTKPGKYTETFRLAAEEWSWVKGGDLEIPITVLGEDTQNPPVAETPDQNFRPVMEEPIIRVGLYRPEGPVIITANGSYEIRDSNNNLIQSLPPNQISTVKYDSARQVYYLTTAGLDQSYGSYLRFIGADPAVIFEITNYSHPPGWNSSLNDNQFRGVLEIRHNSAKNRVWVINELPMETYLKGIAETTSYSPMEYLKTMTIAARSYAMYHFLKGTKHGNEYFHVDAAYDQVYRGYGLEKRHPKLIQSVDETKGVVVTYNNELAITPYFSQSDGRTRDWSEVWGGKVPWAKSVPDPHNAGRKLLGHGVGISARGALLMDLEDGKTYEEILKYYYTGVELERYY
ncbi:MAG TPA: SpoIID/LytB domain-containing protein [Patescibacteria group bacterium]